jgi:hypothetical protein
MTRSFTRVDTGILPRLNDFFIFNVEKFRDYSLIRLVKKIVVMSLTYFYRAQVRGKKIVGVSEKNGIDPSGTSITTT